MKEILLDLLEIVERIDDRLDSVGRDSSSSWCGPSTEHLALRELRKTLNDLPSETPE